MLAKYRASSSAAGQGICRCYIASETKLRNDEGLYAYDCISKPSRISQMNIRSFGNGSFGDGSALTTQINNYATVTEINGKKVSIKDATTTGLAQVISGALVMIHFSHKNSTNVENTGRFFLANVLSSNGIVLTLDATPPDISLKDYNAQVVSIPQFNNFTLATANKNTPKFNGSQGGIFAIAVKNTCNLSGGTINVASKGGGVAYGRAGLATIGNAQDNNKLPIGQGNGSVFILANKLTMNNSTRIGYGNGSSVGRYRGNYNNGTSSNAICGSGASGGTNNTTRYGGYGCNGTKTSNTGEQPQGAHIMIVADTITGFNQYAIGTGGGGGGAGYGQDGDNGGSKTTIVAAGGYNGGGSGAWCTGGSSGWAFVYCNNFTNQNTANIIRANS